MTPVSSELSYKILIVDENINYRNNLATKLRIEGFNVEFASGGFHALHMIEGHKDYNLIIFHENMEDMPAHEIIALIRESKNKSELPVLFISASNNEEEICDMIFIGANEYVVQSTNFKPILERVHKYFNQFKTNVA